MRKRMAEESNIQKCRFRDFEVHYFERDHTFVHIEIPSTEAFYAGLAEYVLDEERLLAYIQNKKSIQVAATRKNLVAIMKRLSLFLDDELMEVPVSHTDLERILRDEFDAYKDDKGELKVRLSKVGRIGEYIFHTILSEYFHFDCIIPKVALTTDKNMSVFGIDELFYSSSDSMLLFGESKVTKCLDNGIALVKSSLTDYEKQIRDEFLLCMSEELIEKANLPKQLVEHIENALTFDQFIQLSGTKNIGIPIFICHGDEINPVSILSRLKRSIARTDLFGLRTTYYVLSLPVVSKDSFLRYLTGAIRLKYSQLEAALE